MKSSSRIRLALPAALLCLLPALSPAQRAAVQEQDPDHPHACGSNARPADVPIVRELQRKGMYQLDEVPELVFSVPMKFHIVRRTNGTGGPTVAALDGDIPVLNAAFLSTGIKFFRTGAIDYIDSDFFYNGITTQIAADALRNTNPVANAINVYFVKDFFVLQSLCGQSSFSYSSPQGIIMDTDCMPNTGNPSTFPHEFGHYFDLLHTHETVYGLECPDGSNCSSAGDLICDTPADPNLAGLVNSACQFTAGFLTLCGSAYNPSTVNYMSAAPRACRTVFTPTQQRWMGAVLVNLRGNLIGTQARVTWVDWDHTGSEFGSFVSPWNTLTKGLIATPKGGTLVIKTGSTPGIITIAQDVFIDTFRGPATVGQ